VNHDGSNLTAPVRRRQHVLVSLNRADRDISVRRGSLEHANTTFHIIWLVREGEPGFLLDRGKLGDRRLGPLLGLLPALVLLRGGIPVLDDGGEARGGVGSGLLYDADGGTLVEAVAEGLAIVDEDIGDGQIGVKVVVVLVVQELLDLEGSAPLVDKKRPRSKTPG